MNSLQLHNPFVSIITVVFNGACCIEKTIQSVINQTYKNIEYIIIDGGSTDGTVDTIKKYASHIDYWVSEPDQGIGDAFNKGIERATGKWVGIINAGDWYETDAVEIIVKNYQMKYEIYCGDMAIYDNHLNYIKTRKSRPGLIRFGMYVMHPTVFVLNQVYDRFNYDTKLRIAMDYDLFLRLIRNKYKIKYIPKLISNMMLGGASSDIIQMRDEEMKVMKSNLTGFDYLIARVKLISEQVILKMIRKDD